MKGRKDKSAIELGHKLSVSCIKCSIFNVQEQVLQLGQSNCIISLTYSIVLGIPNSSFGQKCSMGTGEVRIIAAGSGSFAACALFGE